MPNKALSSPAVSICIPAYLNTGLLSRTLDSLLKQTYQDFELIVTDDSPDDSVAQLLSHFNFGNRAFYQRNSPPLGSPANWNAALTLATGRYIKILHHDDWFASSEALARLVEALEQAPQSEVVFAAGTIVEATNAQPIRPVLASLQQLKQLASEPWRLISKNFLSTPSTMLHRNRSAYRYDTSLKWLVDIDFYVQILSQNDQVIYVDAPLLYISDGTHSVTNVVQNDKKLMLFEYFYFGQKWGINWSKKPYYFTLGCLLAKYDVGSIGELEGLLQSGDLPLRLLEKIIRRRYWFKLLMAWAKLKATYSISQL